MKMPESLHGWIVLLTMLVVGLPSLALGNDQISLHGENLSLHDMAETRGGLSLPGGGFVDFSMDYMRVQFLGNSDPGSSNTSTWINSIQQRATITDDGIQFSMDILQGYGGDGEASNPLAGNNQNSTQNPLEGGVTPGQINNILTQNSLTGFSGMANTNLIAGNYNVGSIVNIFNIKVNFVTARDFNPNSYLSHVLP